MSNSKKRILLISPFFSPEPISTGKYNTDLARALRDRNFHVSVLCSHPFYPKWKPQKSDQNIEGMNIIRGGGNIKYPRNILLKRAILEIWFALFVIRKIIKLRNKIDLVIPVFPPSLYFYFIISLLKKNTRKVSIVHDIQEVYAANKVGFGNKVIRFFINKIEGKSLRSCNKVIFLSTEMKETAKLLYNLSEDKLEVQYPFLNLNTNKTSNDLDEILPKDKIHVVYSGALGDKQNPDKVYELYDFASKRMKNTEFHFFSQGFIFDVLKKKNLNDKIRFHDLVPEKNILELYKKSTIQIIPQLKGSSKGSLPSKLPNLLASGCNLLAITDKNSEIEKLFNKYNLNSVVTLWDNEELCKKLQDLVEKGNKENINHTKVADELFKIDYIVNKIIE